MVYDIAAGLAKENDEDMFLLNCKYKEFVKDGIRFIENNRLKTLLGLMKICSIIRLVGVIFKYPMPLVSVAKFIYQWALMGYLDKIIYIGNYDIVHIHGCSYINMFIIDICEKYNVKFVVTLHGLNSFDDSVPLEESGKQFEKDFLQKAYENQWCLIFISTGMKKRVMGFLRTNKADNIHVVCNSFRFDEVKLRKNDFRVKYDVFIKKAIISGLPDAFEFKGLCWNYCKLLCCVGNIGKRKNQKQIINAFNWMSDELKHKTYVLFIGKEDDSYHFEDAVNKSVWNKHFIRCGMLKKSSVLDFYKGCDGVVMVSLSEGFGLSLIEGMFYGKPCLAINNMDAFEDIYSPDAVVGVAEHDDKLIGKGMEELLTKQWNESLIKKHAEKFTNQNMTKNYMSVMKLCVDM